jgi:tyrosine phenol-lyase
VQAAGASLLVDCGLFQGFKYLRLRNWAPLPVPPSTLQTVLLTHAHIDHSGYLPLLVRNGFRGRIRCTGSTYELCRKQGILVMLDATRALENAWFIQQREDGYQGRSVKEILLEICSYSDGATVSSKKDNLVNIGGFLALRDPELARRARGLLVEFEGLHTYGGMSGRDMEALAEGIREMVASDEHVKARIGQVQYLGETLIKEGVPLVQPIGGHGIFLDARAILPHVPQQQCPAQALTAALYVDSGVRAMERGVVSAGRDPKTGDHRYPRLELVRLAIPRRVYTQAHMDVTAESVVAAYEDRAAIGGLEFTYEPEELRFFQARFRPVDA